MRGYQILINRPYGAYRPVVAFCVHMSVFWPPGRNRAQPGAYICKYCHRMHLQMYAPRLRPPGCARLRPVAPGCARLRPVAPGCARLRPVAPGCARLRPVALRPVAPGCARLRPVAPGCARLRPVAPGCARLRPVAPGCQSGNRADTNKETLKI